MANNPSSYHSRPRPTVQQLVQNIQRSQIPPNPAPQAFPAPAYRGSESVPYTGQNKAPVVKGSEDITVTGYRDGMSDPRRRPKAPAPNQNQNPNQIRNPNQPSRSNRNIANQNQQNPSQGQGQQQGQSRRSGGRQQQNQRASHRGGQSSHDPGVGSSRGNGSGSGGRSRTEPKDKKDKENKGFLCSILGGIFSDGKGGPAPWRTDNRTCDPFPQPPSLRLTPRSSSFGIFTKMHMQ